MPRPTSFIRRLLELRLFLIINLVVLLFLSLSFGREYLRNTTIQNGIHDLEQEKIALETRNLDIIAMSQTIQTQFFLEKEGRTKHGLQKPGERLVVLTEGETLSGDGEAVSEGLGGQVVGAEDQTRVPNAKRWWYYFFNRAAFDELKTYELGS